MRFVDTGTDQESSPTVAASFFRLVNLLLAPLAAVSLVPAIASEIQAQGYTPCPVVTAQHTNLYVPVCYGKRYMVDPSIAGVSDDSEGYDCMGPSLHPWGAWHRIDKDHKMELRMGGFNVTILCKACPPPSDREECGPGCAMFYINYWMVNCDPDSPRGPGNGGTGTEEGDTSDPGGSDSDTGAGKRSYSSKTSKRVPCMPEFKKRNLKCRETTQVEQVDPDDSDSSTPSVCLRTTTTKVGINRLKKNKRRYKVKKTKVLCTEDPTTGAPGSTGASGETGGNDGGGNSPPDPGNPGNPNPPVDPPGDANPPAIGCQMAAAAGALGRPVAYAFGCELPPGSTGSTGATGGDTGDTGTTGNTGGTGATGSTGDDPGPDALGHCTCECTGPSGQQLNSSRFPNYNPDSPTDPTYCESENFGFGKGAKCEGSTDTDDWMEGNVNCKWYEP